jgi:hypothetical protein
MRGFVRRLRSALNQSDTAGLSPQLRVLTGEGSVVREEAESFVCLRKHHPTMQVSVRVVEGSRTRETFPAAFLGVLGYSVHHSGKEFGA